MKKSDPSRLSTEAQQWHDMLASEFAIADPGGLLLLATACEALDRVRQCQRQIAIDGYQVADRFGQHKAHPLLAVERDCRGQMLAALRALHLDIEPLQDGPGRPAGVR